MHRFASYDGTDLGYQIRGEGPPLVCLPGGPGRAAEYLADLGGLDKSRQLILLDPRGVGLSADPADPATFRVDRLVNDVEALRVQLGLDRMDLLGHSAGAILATLYAAAYPERLSSLVLVTPGLAAVGIDDTEEEFRAALAQRATEPWYPAALAARAHATVGIAERHAAARSGYFADAALDPASTRAALAKLTVPVLLYAGDADPMVTPAVVRQAAPLFNDATVVVQPEAAHFPWIDDPAVFAAAVGSFLSQAS